MAFSGFFCVDNGPFEFHCFACDRIAYSRTYAIEWPPSDTDFYCYDCKNIILFKKHMPAMSILYKITKNPKKAFSDVAEYLNALGYIQCNRDENDIKALKAILKPTKAISIEKIKDISGFQTIKKMFKDKIFYLRGLTAKSSISDLNEQQINLLLKNYREGEISIYSSRFIIDQLDKRNSFSLETFKKGSKYFSDGSCVWTDELKFI